MPPLVRSAGPDDLDVVARLYPDLGSGDPPPTRASWDERVMAETTVADLDGASYGFCTTQVLDGEGYVRQVVVDRAARGRGVGRALMVDAARRLRALGSERWRLNVLPDNAPAVGLYRSLGMEIAHESVALDFPWTWLDGRSAAPGAYEVTTPGENAYDTLGGEFALPAGQLATFGARANVHVRALVERDRVVALAAFDVDFPGCFPFRARSFDAALALLGALRPLATAPSMRIVLEDAPALAARFEEAGARPHLRFVHMVGAIPRG